MILQTVICLVVLLTARDGIMKLVATVLRNVDRATLNTNMIHIHTQNGTEINLVKINTMNYIADTERLKNIQT
jgi:hypothetical protein